jgi:hypothetical protein
VYGCRCAKKSAELVNLFPVVWPEGAVGPARDLRALNPCPVELHGASAEALAAPKEPRWSACEGSVPDARGFTCGLWMMFHATAAR